MPRFNKSSGNTFFDSAALGDFLRVKREKLGLTRPELAEQSGSAIQAISNLERGKVIPSIRTIVSLSRSLGLHPMEVIQAGFGEPDAPSSAQLAVLEEAIKGFSDDDLAFLIDQAELIRNWDISPKSQPR